MVCDEMVHHDLVLFGEDSCPFCDEVMCHDGVKTPFKCCDEMNVREREMFVCVSCGMTHSSVFKFGYVDFYSNMFKVRRKSTYRRKYHLDHYVDKMGFELKYGERKEVLDDFNRIIKVLGEGKGKRYPMFDYLFYKLFEVRFLASLDANDDRNKHKCERFMSVKTIEKYDSLWLRICEQNGWSFIETVGMSPTVTDHGS